MDKTHREVCARGGRAKSPAKTAAARKNWHRALVALAEKLKAKNEELRRKNETNP